MKKQLVQNISCRQNSGRFVVAFIDNETPDEAKLWELVAVDANDEDEAIELAQTEIDEERGARFSPLFVWGADQLQNVTNQLLTISIPKGATVIRL